MSRPPPAAAARSLALLRIGVGCFFLIFGEYKVFGTTFTLGGGFQGWIRQFIAQGAYPFMKPVLESFVLPHGTAIAFLVAYGELAIGISLVIGRVVRTASLCGLVFMLVLLFSSSYPGAAAPLWQYFGASLSQSVFALCFGAFALGGSTERFRPGFSSISRDSFQSPKAPAGNGMSCLDSLGVRADFDRIARLMAERPELPERYEPFVLANVPAAAASVLEVGCGAGALARALARRGARVSAIDLSPEMIGLARRRSAGDARIELVCADFLTHDLPPRSFDALVSMATLHHLPAVAALDRMKGLLKPGGVLVIHDVRSTAGAVDATISALRAAVNGDAWWWLSRRVRQDHALREAWHDHGRDERYLTIQEARAVAASALPGARVHSHPLWRYTIVWRKAPE